MSHCDNAALAHALNRLGLKMLHDCTTGVIRIYDMYSGAEFGRFNDFAQVRWLLGLPSASVSVVDSSQEAGVDWQQERVGW